MGLSDATIESKWLFQFSFCAVSLAIVWGTTLERIKFGVYIIYAIVFAGLIYPIGSHWVFGGGWLQTNLGMQDFAGSTAVHLIGATGAFAVLLLLGARIGKYDKEGRPRAIPGHNMPLFGLGVLILWLGWFGFNPGSTLSALDGRFPEIALVTLLAAAAGVLTAVATAYWKTKAFDIGMAGNGAIGALVGITAPSGYVEPWAAVIIGAIAGVIVPLGVYAIDRKIDDPVGALTAHGLCGIWGTLACGIFTAPRLAEYNGFGEGGLLYTGSLHQLGTQALGVVVVFTFVFTLSFATFWLIKKTYGLRVSAEEEEAGLDITEHGMYGYPEQFIPAPELIGYATAPHGSRDIRRPPAPSSVRCRHEEDRGVHPPRGVRADPHGAAQPGLPLADDLGGQGVGPPEGGHRALSRRGADQLPAAQGQARVRRRHHATWRPWSARSSSTHGPARSATGRCSSCRSRRPTASARASRARRRSRPTRRRPSKSPDEADDGAARRRPLRRHREIEGETLAAAPARACTSGCWRRSSAAAGSARWRSWRPRRPGRRWRSWCRGWTPRSPRRAPAPTWPRCAATC